MDPPEYGCPKQGAAKLKAIGRRGKRMRKTILRGPLCDFVRGKPDVVNYESRKTDPCHVRPTGAGWLDWLRVEGTDMIVGNVAPLTRAQHREHDQDLHTEAFNQKYNCDLALEAEQWGIVFANMNPAEFTRIKEAMQ